MKDIFKLPTGECLGVELKKKRGVMNLLTDFLHQGWDKRKKKKPHTQSMYQDIDAKL